MAFFTSNDNKKSVEPATKGATVIASGTKFNGDITLSSSSLHIDGEVEGIIHSDNAIIIGSKGRVNGEIFATKLVINGAFKGSAESDVIEILPRGKVKAKLVYSELTIEKGAGFEGETIMRSSSAKENGQSKRSTDNKIELLPSGKATRNK